MKYVNAILKPFLILVITIFLTTLVPSVAAEFLPFGDTGKAVAAQLFVAVGQILTAFLIALSVKKDNSIIISEHFTLKNVSIKKAAAIAVCTAAASLFSVELLSMIFFGSFSANRLRHRYLYARIHSQRSYGNFYSSRM